MFEQEKEILLEHGFALDYERLAKDRLVVFSGAVSAYSDRRLTLIFSDDFPSFPPRVFDTADSRLLRRHHHPGTRQLCLFGPGNARWSAQLTCRDVLAEAHQLLARFGSESEEPDIDDVPEPASAVLTYRPGVAILVPPPISSLQPNQAVEVQGNFIARCDRVTKDPELEAQGLVLSAIVSGKSEKADASYADAFDGRGHVITGQIFYIEGVLSGAALMSAVDRRLSQSGFKKDRWTCFLFREQSGAADMSRLAWLFVREVEKSRYEFVETFAYRASERSRRVPTLRNLDQKKVSVIGCGSLGSKIAAALAASGLGQVTLVDRDRYEPNNSVRHDTGIGHYGQRKVNAVAERLRDLNREIEITPLFHRIGAAESVEEDAALMEELAESDMIIETTGSHGVSRWVNERLFLLGVPGVFVSVTNGAWAGEIVRVVPGGTACWLCWNSQYREDPPPGEPTDGVFHPGCGQPSFTGTTFEIGAVADLASSVITATLLSDNSGVATVNGDYLRWIGRNEREYILTTNILPVRKRTGCRLCDPAA